MDEPSLATREPWLPAFFSGDNGIKWAEITSGTTSLAAAVRAWLPLIETGRAHHGVVLPARAADGRVIWYACAASRQDRAALAEQIASFLGPALVDFDRTRTLVAHATYERVLADRFAGGVQAFTAHAGVESLSVGDQLSLLATLLLRRPPRPRATLQPFATVRAEFEQALLTGDEAQARRSIEELRATGRLSAANERFMHVRLLVALGREAALVRDVATMSLLVDAELPIRVLRDVIEALYTVHLAPLEAGASPEAWVAAYRQHIRRHERLFRARRGLRAPTVLRAFLLCEAARPPDKFRAGEATALHDTLAALPEHKEWADALLAWALAQQSIAPAGAAPSPAAVARYALQAEASVAHWAAQPPSPQAMAALLAAAMGAGTLEAAAEALTALRAYPAELLQGLSPMQKAMRTVLEQLVPPPEAAAPVPVDWTDWARWLATAAASEEARALAIAEQGAEQWDHAAWLGDVARVHEFTKSLQAHPARFRPYLATIHGSLHGVTAAPAVQAEVLAQMIMLVALDAPVPADLPLLTDWVAAMVRLGAGRAMCDEVAGALHAAWSEVRSMRSLDWACDVVEALAAAPRTPGGDLELMFSDVLGFAVAQQHRLSSAQRHIIGLLARDFGLDFAPAEIVPACTSEPAVDATSFAGVSIGIYTLQESIVPHLRMALQDSFPGATVQFNHDHVATPALEQMAKHSSVMVFAWLCSKHQAFYCVQRYRPADKPLLQPVGRGSASIVRALSEHFSSATPVSA